MWADGLGLKLKVKPPKNRISVHFRFGDSVWAQNHNDYYHKVVNELRDVDDVVYVVSDDHEKAQQILNNTDICYEIFSSNMIEEFLFLAESEICFCAPSTFSWWASIINIRYKTRIVMPQYLGKRFPLKEDSIQFL